MVSALDSGSRGLGSSPGRCTVVFFNKTFYSESGSLPPGAGEGGGGGGPGLR